MGPNLPLLTYLSLGDAKISVPLTAKVSHCPNVLRELEMNGNRVDGTPQHYPFLVQFHC